MTPAARPDQEAGASLARSANESWFTRLDDARRTIEACATTTTKFERTDRRVDVVRFESSLASGQAGVTRPDLSLKPS